MAIQLPNVEVPFTDKGGNALREWYRYFNDLGIFLGAAVGLIPVKSGGTGLASGTPGGVLYFSGSVSIASSAELTQNQIIFGGGAGNPPSTPLGGTSAHRVLLSGNAAALPSWSGYTMPTDTFQGDILYSPVNEVIQRLPKDTHATRSLTNTGTNNNPAWALVNLTTGVTDELLVNNVLQVQVYGA